MSFSEKVERFARGVIQKAKRAHSSESVYISRGQAHISREQARKSRPPPTPHPAYICSNCGKLIKSTQGHTRTECEEHKQHYVTEPKETRKSPPYPDHRVMFQPLPGSKGPRIRAPYYTEEASA